MKSKKLKTRIFSFHSISAPADFSARLCEEAAKVGMRAEQTETGFDLYLRSHHGGKEVYRALICADERGGSLISGEILTVPWRDKSDDKSIFRGICYVLGAIVLVPFVLLFLFVYGVYALIVRLFRGKTTDPTDEEVLCDFMTNKMCCKKE